MFGQDCGFFHHFLYFRVSKKNLWNDGMVEWWTDGMVEKEIEIGKINERKKL